MRPKKEKKETDFLDVISWTKKAIPEVLFVFFVLIYGGTSDCFLLYVFREMGGGSGSCVSFFFWSLTHALAVEGWPVVFFLSLFLMPVLSFGVPLQPRLPCLSFCLSNSPYPYRFFIIS